MGLTVTTNHLIKTNKVLNTELGVAINNTRSYESMMSGLKDENTVLRLNIRDLSHSKDIVVQSLDSTRKALKIKDNELKMATRIETIIRDTSNVALPITPNCDFSVVIQKHPWSKYKISRKDTVLTHIATILNAQDLIVSSPKVWRNPGKNFFQRLFTLDFKKDRILKYKIVNTNPDMKITDTRVIYINE